MEVVVDVLSRRLTALGIDAEVEEVAEGEIGVFVTELDALDAAADVLTRRGAIDFRPVLDAVEGAMPTLDVLGPSAVTADGVETAVPDEMTGQFVVALTLTVDGIAAFNELAAQCFDRAPRCPTGQVAIVHDGEVISAPTVEAVSFERNDIVISGAFSERGARELAAVLDGGALPVELRRVD